MKKIFTTLPFALSMVAVLLSSPVALADERKLNEYVPVLESVLKAALPVNPDTGIYSQELRRGVHLVSDGIWQSAFVVTSEGVIVIDAPETYAPKIRTAIAQATDQPIRMLIYSHAHKDHIGGSAAFADIDGLEIVALEGVEHFLAEKQDPNRLVPTVTFKDRKTITMGNKTIELTRARNYHSDEGDMFIYVPDAKFLMAVDTLAPGYVPFSGFDITSNFHEYKKVFDDILAYDFDYFVGGHLTAIGTREDVEMTKAYTNDVYKTVKRIHAETNLPAVMAEVMAETADAVGGWDNKFLLFKVFLDTVVAKATAEIEGRWIDKLAGVDVWADTHVRTALIYVRWDD